MNVKAFLHKSGLQVISDKSHTCNNNIELLLKTKYTCKITEVEKEKNKIPCIKLTNP